MYTYGLFNIARIPFGLGYFFAPIWVFEGADGKLLFEAEQTRLFDAVELPPSSFFLTDLLPIVFIVFLAASIRRPQFLRPIALGQLLALVAGLAVPCVLMLTAIYAAYRYRMEFYPEIDLLAFFGFYAATSSAGVATVGPPLRRSSASYQHMACCSFTIIRQVVRLNLICTIGGSVGVRFSRTR